MRRGIVVAALGSLVFLGGCGVTLQDEPEPLGPATEAPSPAPTVSLQPDMPSSLPPPPTTSSAPIPAEQPLPTPAARPHHPIG